MKLRKKFRISGLEVKYLTSSHYDRFHCPGPECAICCLEEMEEFSSYGVCRNLNKKENLCSIYGERPVTCRVFPFQYVLFNGDVIIRPTLNCPYFTDSENFPELDEGAIDFDEKCMEQIESRLKIESRYSGILKLKDIASVEDIYSNHVRKYLADPASEFNEFYAGVKDAFSDAFGIDVTGIKEPLTPDQWMRSDSFGGCYINPNFDGEHMPRPLFTGIRVTTKRDKVQFRDRESSQFVSIGGVELGAGLDGEALDMASDYMLLGIKNHLAYIPALATFVRGGGLNMPAIVYMMHAYLHVAYFHSNLLAVANRYPGETIGYETMREVLALNDCSIHGNLGHGYSVLEASVRKKDENTRHNGST